MFINDFSAISCAINLLSHTILSVVELVAILLRACFTVVYWCLWWLCWVHILLTVAVVVLFSWQLHTTACHLDKFKLRSFGVNTFIRYQAYLLQSCGTALPKSQMSVKCQIHPMWRQMTHKRCRFFIISIMVVIWRLAQASICGSVTAPVA